MRRIAFAIVVCLTPVLLHRQASVTTSRGRTISAATAAGTTSCPCRRQHRVYIGRTNRVMVVDTTDGKLVGEVMGIKGAHGTAIAASRAATASRPRATINRS